MQCDEGTCTICVSMKLAENSFSYPIIVVLIFSSLATISGEISEDAKKTIEKWAPKLWVHHEEFFKPSNVEYFLQNTQVQDQNDAVLQENPTVSTILNGESTTNYNLNTRSEITGPQDFLPFFSGQDVRVPGLVREAVQ